MDCADDEVKIEENPKVIEEVAEQLPSSPDQIPKLTETNNVITKVADEQEDPGKKKKFVFTEARRLALKKATEARKKKKFDAAVAAAAAIALASTTKPAPQEARIKLEEVNGAKKGNSLKRKASQKYVDVEADEVDAETTSDEKTSESEDDDLPPLSSYQSRKKLPANSHYQNTKAINMRYMQNQQRLQELDRRRQRIETMRRSIFGR